MERGSILSCRRPMEACHATVMDKQSCGVPVKILISYWAWGMLQRKRDETKHESCSPGVLRDAALYRSSQKAGRSLTIMRFGSMSDKVNPSGQQKGQTLLSVQIDPARFGRAHILRFQGTEKVASPLRSRDHHLRLLVGNSRRSSSFTSRKKWSSSDPENCYP